MANLIQQKFSSDCGVAALAMFLGRPYEDVAVHCSGWELMRHGLSGPRTDFLASLFGVEISYRHPDVIDWTKPAVLSVPSLNIDGSHAVYWDGQRINDPNEGKAGKRVYSESLDYGGRRSAQEQCFVGYQRNDECSVS